MAQVRVSLSTPPPTPLPTIERVTLSLSEDEAVFVGAVLGNLATSQHGQAIYDALEDAGFGHSHPQYVALTDRIKRNVFRFIS